MNTPPTDRPAMLASAPHLLARLRGHPRRRSLLASALAACTALALGASAPGVSDDAPPSKKDPPASGSKEPGSPGKKDSGAPDKKDSTTPAKGSKSRAADPSKIAKMQLRLDPEDRAALDRNLNYTLMSPSEKVEWLGSAPMSVEALRGRVVVIQSLSTKQSNWKSASEPLKRQFQTMETDPPVLILLHTPEGADRAKKILEPSLGDSIAVIDEDGAWCDDLGVWKRPVNLVVDRDGIVRYAGLTNEGVLAAVEHLRGETANPEAPNKQRPVASEEDVKFPTYRDMLPYSADRRGTEMPALAVDTWINGAPERGDRLLVLDFWATWCKPCRDAIPHMNELADRFASDACFVGISDETKSKFERGLADKKLKERDFRYSLALDPQARLKNGFFAVKGIPHCVVISSDNIVRWQGMPGGLTDERMQELIAANKALKSGGGGASGKWKAAASKSGGSSRGAPPKRKGY